ncbi:hypothetical protein B296_00026884 [Ensete ventricosum]|uniref:Uncharacterized protein n=1 Tax=Ensete ventricosum TaxID=4639 RepID=A0A427A3P8_ENSVE|nr:hypothetical protein B296_00026884 [Ensete ventricosum]
MNRPTTIKPSTSPTANKTSQPKELSREELRERSTEGLYLRYDEPWSRNHRCRKKKLLVIEPIKDLEPKDIDPEPDKEEAEEEPQPAISTIHALAGYSNPQTMKVDGFLEHQSTILIDTESTNNFTDSKVAARLTFRIEDCNRFDIKVADGRIHNCNQKVPWVKLVLQGQEITADFFLLPLDDYQAVLGIEWLSTLGDVSWKFPN